MTEKIPGCVWTNEAVTLLLTLYLREKQKDHPVKLKKKEIWKYICGELLARGLLCSWQECDKKYRNLKQTFVRNLKQAGKKECRWMFFPIMLEINKHEPFVNEMVTNAFAHSSSNTSISDYDNDNDHDQDCNGNNNNDNDDDDDDAANADADDDNDACFGDVQPTLPLPPPPASSQNGQMPADEQIHRSYTTFRSFAKVPSEIPDIILQNRILMQNPFLSQAKLTFPRTAKTPSPHRTTVSPPQTSPLSLTSSASPQMANHTTNGIIHGDSSNHQIHQSHIKHEDRGLHHHHHNHNYQSFIDYDNISPPLPPPLKRQRCSGQHQITSNGNCNSNNNNNTTISSSNNKEPPQWFKEFLVEFKISESRKMQTIQDLCDEIRRTNDIEHQRNAILNEKNELLKNLIDLMNPK